MAKARPVNLDIFFGRFTFPLPAIASIIHRVTGGVLFVGVGFLLYALNLALQSEQGFADAHALIDTWLGKLIAWGVLSALAYHFVAGIKHLIMDFGIGETLAGARQGAWISIVGSLVLIGLAGLWLW